MKLTCIFLTLFLAISTVAQAKGTPQAYSHIFDAKLTYKVLKIHDTKIKLLVGWKIVSRYWIRIFKSMRSTTQRESPRITLKMPT